MSSIVRGQNRYQRRALGLSKDDDLPKTESEAPESETSKAKREAVEAKAIDDRYYNLANRRIDVEMKEVLLVKEQRWRIEAEAKLVEVKLAEVKLVEARLHLQVGVFSVDPSNAID